MRSILGAVSVPPGGEIVNLLPGAADNERGDNNSNDKGKDLLPDPEPCRLLMNVLMSFLKNFRYFDRSLAARGASLPGCIGRGRARRAAAVSVANISLRLLKFTEALGRVSPNMTRRHIRHNHRRAADTNPD